MSNGRYFPSTHNLPDETDVNWMAFNIETVKSPMRLNFIQRLPAAKTVICLTSLMLTLIPGFSGADDTEIFFGRNSAQPNVLFILDVSGSMGDSDGTGSSRLQRLRTALTTLLNTTTDINVGLFTYNGHGAQVHHAIAPVTQDGHREAMIATLNGLTAEQSTPTVLALHEGKKYFRGEALVETRVRSELGPFTYDCTDPDDTDLCRDQSDDTWGALRNRLPDPNSYTLGPGLPTAVPPLAPGSINSHPHCTDADLDHPSCVTQEIIGDAKYVSPIVSECQSNHIVLLTDGEPTASSHAIARADLIKEELDITECSGVGTVGFPAGGACGKDLANDTWLTSVSADYGTHHDADSAQTLLTAFESILDVVEQEINTFVSPAVTVDRFTGLSHREDVYLALFKPSADTTWSGNLKRYAYTNSNVATDPPRIEDRENQPAIDPLTGNFFTTAKSWWSNLTDGDDVGAGGAANRIESNGRNIYTQLVGNNLNTSGNALHEDNQDITPALLAIAPEQRLEVLQWARGVDVLDYDNDPTTTIRKQIGDPLHSQPLTVSYDAQDMAVFFGTNQGYLHAIDSETGDEIFSFVPQDLLPNLEEFYTNERRATKLYGLDGDITSWVKDENRDGIINGNDHAYVYVGMRRGGKNYYALDVTDKNNPKHLWTIRGGATAVSRVAPGDENIVNETLLPDMGQSWSKPTLANLMINGTKTKVLIFGGGYDALQDNVTMRAEDNEGRAIYIIDAATGEKLWMDTQATNGDMKYSIPSDPTVIDIDSDGIADQLYIGDMGGQLWRYDFNRTSVGDLAKGGVIADFGTAVNPRKFFYKPDLALIKHPDGDFLSVSIGSGNRAHPLGESTNDRFYMVKQYDIIGAPDEYGIKEANSNDYRPIEEADLHDATPNDVQSTDLTTANDALEELRTAPGWFIKLEQPGEKVLAHSLTINEGINFSTYLPNAVDTTNPCSPALGKSRLYRVQAFDAVPTKGTSRYTTNSGGGLPSPASLFFSDNGEIYIQQGTRTVDATNLSRVIRTHWAEQTE